MRSNSEASNSPDVQSPGIKNTPSLADLEQEEERIRLEEDEEIERKRQAAAGLALERGLQVGNTTDGMSESKAPMVEELEPPKEVEAETVPSEEDRPSSSSQQDKKEDPVKGAGSTDFIPARLPNFG
jgi:hypothetical protein